MLATPAELYRVAVKRFQQAYWARNHVWKSVTSPEWAEANEAYMSAIDDLGSMEELVRAGVPRWITVPVAWESALKELRND